MATILGSNECFLKPFIDECRYAAATYHRHAQHSVLKANKCANSKEKGLKYFDLKANESAN